MCKVFDLWQKKCEKITFVEAGILERAKVKQERLNSTQEAVRILIKTIQIITANKTNFGNTGEDKRGGKLDDK